MGEALLALLRDPAYELISETDLKISVRPGNGCCKPARLVTDAQTYVYFREVSAK